MPSSSQASDRFTLCAFFLHDTRLVLNLPRTDSDRRSSGLSAEDVGRRLNRLFDRDHAGLPRLEFTWHHPREMVDLDDRQSWVVYTADMDPNLVIPPTPAETQFANEMRLTKCSIWLYENGVVILTVYAEIGTSGRSWREAQLLETVDASLSYLGDNKELAIHVQREVLGRLGTVLRGAAVHFKSSSAEQPRERKCVVEHPYPALLGIVHSQDVDVGTLELAATPLARTTRLHMSEMTSVLSKTAPDYLAVGYESVWLLQGGPWSTRRETEARIRRIRLPAFMALHLAVWMQLYSLESELEILLAQLRLVRRGKGRGAIGAEPGDEQDVLQSVSVLRGELEAVGRQLSPQRLSTWGDEVRLFAAIRRSWFIEDSLKSLQDGLQALHHELMELEQRRLTYLASVFAGTGVAGMLMAVGTLLLTRIELELSSEQSTWLGVKVGVVALAIWLPAFLISPLLRRWYRQVNQWLRIMPLGGHRPRRER